MTTEDTFWRVHDALPQQAPGSQQTTLHLLDLAGNPSGKALDIGCGQGRASLLLAKSGLNVTAIDTHQPFLDQLKTSAHAQSLGNKIAIKNISMDQLHCPDASLDLIWSEGAAYLMGLEKAMQSWRSFLKPNGQLVIIECCWLTDNPSPELKQFWKVNYPTMPNISTVVSNAKKRGYDVSHTYIVPRSDWDAYYQPMEQVVAELVRDYATDPDAMIVIADKKQEIKMYEDYGDEYGYVGFVLKMEN